MVQLSTPFFTLAILVTSCLGSPIAIRDVATVEADLAKVQTQIQTLDKDINAFPDTGGSLGIHSDATNLETGLNQATTDTKATSAFSESDGRTILDTIEAAEPVILDALTAIVKKKPAFDALPIGGVSAIVLSDLKTLASDTAALEAALIANSPADLVDEANGVKTSIDNGFAAAIAAYS